MRAPFLVGLFTLIIVAVTVALVGPLSRQGLASPPEISSAIEPALVVTRARAEAQDPSTFAPTSERAPAAESARAAESAPPAQQGAPPAQQGERADAHFDGSHRSPLANGLLLFPPSFSSADGAYDLVVHFNGNTDLVEESYGFAGINAVVMILNLGVGSGLYEDRFAEPSAFQLILDRVQNVMTHRGLKNAKLRRIAVSAWSSGYGGVIRVLDNDAQTHRIDAVILFDALHCGYIQGTKKLKPDQIGPITRFAQRAVEGHALLSITHSKIETYGYLNAQKTADVILDATHVLRTPTNKGQVMPDLASMVGVLPKALMVPLKPLTEAHRGGLHIRGYSGSGPITHMLHLVQMSTTALPDLKEWWSQPAAPPPVP